MLSAEGLGFESNRAWGLHQIGCGVQIKQGPRFSRHSCVEGARDGLNEVVPWRVCASPALRFRVWGSGLRVKGLGFSFQGMGFGFRVQGLEFRF